MTNWNRKKHQKKDISNQADIDIMLDQLEELVQNSNSEHANYCTVKQDILKLQRDNQDKINGNICNEWMF